MTSPRPTYGQVWRSRSVSDTTPKDHLTYTPPLEACEGLGAAWRRCRAVRNAVRPLGAELLWRPYRRGFPLRAGLVARALAAPRDAPPKDARERGVVARGAADRVGGARRAAGARGGVRVRAERADGWVGRLRLGEAVFGCDGPEVRARALGADRVAGARSRIDILRVMPPEWDRAVGRGVPERDWAVGRGAAVEGVWVPGRPVSSARDDRSGLPDGVGALRRLVVADARSEDDVGRREVVAREGG